MAYIWLMAAATRGGEIPHICRPTVSSRKGQQKSACCVRSRKTIRDANDANDEWRWREWGAQPGVCQVPGHSLHSVIRRSFTVVGWMPPAIHGRGPLVGEVEFAHQAAAVIHHDPLLDANQLHPFPSQRSAYFPAATCAVEPALGGQLAHLRSGGVFPDRRVRAIAAFTVAPHRCRSSHLQGFVRPHVIVFVAE